MERSRRVLDELVVEGMATVLPFHRAVVRDPAFELRVSDDMVVLRDELILRFKVIDERFCLADAPGMAIQPGFAKRAIPQRQIVEGGQRLVQAGGGGGGREARAAGVGRVMHSFSGITSYH